LILDNQRWTLPTFVRNESILEDAKSLLDAYSQGKVLPIELYLSEDRGFEYGTYVCLVDKEFLTVAVDTVAWSSLHKLPKHLHTGLSATLNNQLIQTKIDTILELENAVI
jgi:hypothetical protein